MTRLRPSRPTLPLLGTPLFKRSALSPPASAQLSYQRAKAIGLAYEISVEDVMELTDKFWDLHRDPILSQDGAAATILTIHYNLAAGTLARYLPERDDLCGLLQDIIQWRKNAQFCLTELGHGLDISNLQTVADLLPNGDFSLNTPTPEAAKFMPPTVPSGIPCVAIVWARLRVDTQDYGIRPFVVPLNDGFQMCEGVTARLLPHRGGARPINHSLTYFNHVRLPSSALLGTLEKPMMPHLELMSSIWRVAVGSLALGVTALSMMPIYTTIATRYSMRRVVRGSQSHSSSILQFTTQQIPILTALAQIFVLQAFQTWAVKIFTDTSLDPRIRHGIATCFKAVAVQHSQTSNLAVSERCGAQGLMAYNQMSVLHEEVRGIGIAEGDILVLSIRLATELLLGRYGLPPAANPNSLLARHEHGLLLEAKEKLDCLPGHRSPQYNRYILPRCQLIVESIGHRMAYDAAVAAGVHSYLVDLYVASVMKLDLAWYTENMGITRLDQFAMQDKAVRETMPKIEELLLELDVEEFAVAPIVSEETWDGFVNALPLLGGPSEHTVSHL